MTYLESVIISLNYVIQAGWFALILVFPMLILAFNASSESEHKNTITYYLIVTYVVLFLFWILLTIFVPSPRIFN